MLFGLHCPVLHISSKDAYLRRLTASVHETSRGDCNSSSGLLSGSGGGIFQLQGILAYAESARDLEGMAFSNDSINLSHALQNQTIKVRQKISWTANKVKVPTTTIRRGKESCPLSFFPATAIPSTQVRLMKSAIRHIADSRRFEQRHALR